MLASVVMLQWQNFKKFPLQVVAVVFLSEKQSSGNSFLVENWPLLLRIFQDLEDSQIAEYEVISQPFMPKRRVRRQRSYRSI